MDRNAVLAMCVHASDLETKINAPGYVKAPVELEPVVEELVRDGLLERWPDDTDFVRPTELGRAEAGPNRIQ